MVGAPVNLEIEKKKNIKLALGVASLGVIGFFCIYSIFFTIMFFSPWVFFNFLPFSLFSEDVAGLDGNLLIFSKSFDFKGATYEQPPREKITLRMYDGESLSEPEEIQPFASLYPAEKKMHFFVKGFYRTFDMRTWEEFKNPAIGSNPKGAVGTDGIWVLSVIKKKPVLRLITKEETKEVPLPDDVLEEERKVCSSQLLSLGNELHLFWKDGDNVVWYRYDGKRWDQPEVFEESGEYKGLLLDNKVFLVHSRHFGDHLEIALRNYNGFFWSEPKTFEVRGLAISTIPAVYKDKLIIFQQGLFSQKYYLLEGETIEGPYTISKPFFFFINIWKIIVVTLLSQIIFFLCIFLVSLLVRKYKLKTWRVHAREYEFASLFRRSLAMSIDFILITIPAVAPFYFVLNDDPFFENPFQYIGLAVYSMVVMLLGSFLYHSLLEGLWGKTIGKKMCGIIVLKDDFTKCTIGRGFLRNVMRIVDGFFYYLVAAAAMAGTMKWQRLGDIVAGTVVVRDRTR